MNLIEEYNNFKLAAEESLKEGFPRENLVNTTYGNVLMRNLLRKLVEDDLHFIDSKLKYSDKNTPASKELQRNKEIVVLADRLIVIHLNNVNIDYNVFKLKEHKNGDDLKTVIKIESNKDNHENYKDEFVDSLREAYWTKTSTIIKIRCRNKEEAKSKNPIRIEENKGQITAVFNVEPWNGLIKYSDGKSIKKVVVNSGGNKKFKFLLDSNPVKNYQFKDNSWIGYQE